MPIKFNVKKVAGLPLNFTGQVGDVLFRVVKQYDIYGNINASIEDLNTNTYILSVNGRINADTLADSFAKYVNRQDKKMSVDVVKKQIKPFFTQLNKDVKDENKKENKPKSILKEPYLVSRSKSYDKILKKKSTPKKAAKKTSVKKVSVQRGSTNLLRDKKIQALPPGKRKSASGKTYYEYRANRSDKGILLGTHKDTKSHNVNIRVVSGINKLMGLFDLSIINDIDALKKEYYKLAKKYHPDAGGTKEQFQNLQKEYENLLNKLLTGSKLSEEQKTNEIILDEAIREIINNVIHLETITVEVIGKWLWIGAATGYNFDTPTYNILKSAGLSYIKKAGRPFMVYRGVESKSRGKTTMEEIRKKYGSSKFEAGKGRLITGINKVNKVKLKSAIKKALKALDKRPI